MWDPQLPGGQNEPERILEEGFMDSDAYKVQMFLSFLYMSRFITRQILYNENHYNKSSYTML